MMNFSAVIIVLREFYFVFLRFPTLAIWLYISRAPQTLALYTKKTGNQYIPVPTASRPA